MAPEIRKTSRMETDQDATVITFPTRHATAANADIGAALTELDTDLRSAAERLRFLSIELDRRLQFGHLNHIDDPIAFAANLSDHLDSSARTLSAAGQRVQAATELWNRENKQH